MPGDLREGSGRRPDLKIDAAMDGFEQAVLHVGRSAFPDALMAHLRRVAAVDHCMVFAFANDRDAQCLLTAGDIAIGDDLGALLGGIRSGQNQTGEQQDSERESFHGEEHFLLDLRNKQRLVETFVVISGLNTNLRRQRIFSRLHLIQLTFA